LRGMRDLPLRLEQLCNKNNSVIGV